MTGKHEATLRAIFHLPTLGTIPWADIESLFRTLGAELKEGRGSRVRVIFMGRPQVFHRPHPQKETRKAAVELVRELLILSTELRTTLTALGITP